MAGSTPASLIIETALETGPAVAGSTRPVSPGTDAWRRFRKHRLALASLFVLALMVLAVTVGPLLWGVAINDIDFSAMLQGPSAAHPLGTDDLGQDVLARLLYGGRISLAVGLAAMVVAVVVGVFVGAVSGMASGRIDARTSSSGRFTSCSGPRPRARARAAPLRWPGRAKVPRRARAARRCTR